MFAPRGPLKSTRVSCAAAFLAFTFLLSNQAWSFDGNLTDFFPERRENLADLAPGFLAFPIYSHLPGIGSTYGASIMERNIFGSRAGFLMAATFGDLKVLTTALSDVHLIRERLVFSAYLYDARVPYQWFERGLSGGRHDFFYLDQRARGGNSTLEYFAFEKRIQILGQLGVYRSQVVVRDSSAREYQNADREEYTAISELLRLRLDLTDHWQDPRRGLRIDLSGGQTLSMDSYHSRFFTTSVATTGYVPLGSSSTLALNFIRSGAQMYHRSDKTDAQLRQGIGLNCSDSACQNTEDIRVAERSAENRYGNALTLGGANTLRSYAGGRARGSQSLFYGSELRWNLTNENTPFDFKIMSGARSIVQLALFYEAGAASDPGRSVAYIPPLQTYGFGMRYGFSGAVLRADFGMGSEGSQFTLFFGYPWEPSSI